MDHYLSENFTYKEFEESEKAEKLGIDNTIKHDMIRNNIKELVFNILQPLRDKFDVPIHINSGYRCLKLNNALGGVASSQHVMGQAADIIVEGKKPIEVAEMIVEMGLPYDQIGLYDTFVHVSVSSRQRNHIFYDKSYKGSKL
jgi:uncharacterized protein YcbK (DUF882 family)